MFSNEFSLPYLTKVKTETVAAMARIIGELMPEIDVPFGVNVLWDPVASMDLAQATGANLYAKSLPAYMPVISEYGIPIAVRRFATNTGLVRMK